MLFRFTFKGLTSAALIFSSVHFASAQANNASQDASQLGFTGLQTQANSLVEDGKLIEAMPLLKELVKRVEAANDTNSDIQLDFPLFLIGTGHIQQYVNSGKNNELLEALKWYDKLEKEFPDSPKMKDMLLKRIDVYRVLNRNDDAIALMQRILSGAYSNVRLSYAEQTKLLKDLTQVYYSTGQLAAGLPYFGQLLDVARSAEDQALAAAASFEALIEAKRLDGALRLLPTLARESAVRYRPRLNVALLKASDTLVDAGRMNDAALTLNLIKTTDIMIEWHEAQIETKTARMEQRIAFGNSQEEVERLQQELKTLKGNLAHLRNLPTLRNELLVRRARNYTNTARRYEAFWMFNDLMVENPKDPESEFYHYATFSNALQIGKRETAITVGKRYRSLFPDGDYYSDVTGALANELKESGQVEEFMALATHFLGSRPQDPIGSSLFAQWASYLIEQQRYAELINQAAEWYNAHQNTIYEDGIFYWGGLAELQLSQFEDSVGSFTRLVEQYPNSVYAEDGLLRKGAALFYAQRFEEARDTLYGYVDQYPKGQALDQAYFFLGEVEYLAGKFELALEHFYKANEITGLQDVHNGASFRIGSVLEELGRYEEMAQHFIHYINQYGEKGDLTRAVLQLGLAYEYLMRPVEMLALYRENIEKFAQDINNVGVDALIEGYAEKYSQNLATLTATVAFFDRLEDDLEFREKIVSDRGFLFEHFYVNSDLDQTLYNKLRQHAAFTPELIKDLTPIESLITPYRTQLESYPSESPESYFKAQLTRARAQNDFFREIRMLMGLYRLGVEMAPSRSYDSALIETLTPRAILYVADYERDKRLEFAEQAWNQLLINYPTDATTIVAFMRLADVTAEKGDTLGALNYLEQIVTQFPGSPKVPAVMLRQGELLSELNRGNEAREKYQYILRVPEWRGVLHAQALQQIGESYMAEQAYAEAHGFFERTFLGYPHLAEWSARAYLSDAKALLAMGEKQDAIRTLQEAIDELSSNAPEDILQAIKAKLKELQL
ncbi:tetratricopeptide repeat protein [Coraliomargarita sp. SDUM461004]|uniref:Tetratricopeptide repeat protein n=1 Tax=Thalassobacterium sedimentorum TaxID=3041258 RepID=A0ABU1ALB3_9BACT|nr:tetratricopeptide repeat protein [Coraliomargarita sp. SDUM461004]MDQ8195517.1 tetratricopeptide repeat protein [Coraliomargarita sp. SDUM461004]